MNGTHEPEWVTRAERMLADLSRPERMLEPVQAIQHAVELRDFAEAARVTAKQAKLGIAAINYATVVKLKAERWIAEYVDAGQAAKQIAPQGHPAKPSDSEGLLTFADLDLVARAVYEARTIRDRYTPSELDELAVDATAHQRHLSRDSIVRRAGWDIREQAQGRYADTAGLGHADLLLVDPPWRHTATLGDDRKVANHYPTMSLEDICALPLPIGDVAVVFCWTTPAILADTFQQVLPAWQLEYRSHLVWAKDKIGMGYYFRAQHELLLLTTRGDPPIPAPGDRPPSLLISPRREHSRKPDAVYELIERMYPHASKRELFARTRREGWLEPWGLDAPAAVPP